METTEQQQPYQNVQPHPLPLPMQRQRSSWLLPLIISLLGPLISGIVMLFIVLIIFGAIAGGDINPDDGVDEVPQLNTVWSYGYGTSVVARIPIKGVLMVEDDPGLFGTPGPVLSAIQQIRAATQDPEVNAIILEIDSPGGGVTCSDLIYNELMKFKASDEDRVVVAILGDIAASGGYYVAAAADYIIAHPTTITGSIGVIISKLNIKGLGEQYGVKLETIKSGANKDLLSPFEDLTQEQRDILQGVVNEMYERFVSLIVEGREMTAEEVKARADGQIFSGVKAIEYGFVDEIGYWDDAVEVTAEFLGEKDIRVIRYKQDILMSSLLLGVEKNLNANRTRFAELGRTRLMYMWEAW